MPYDLAQSLQSLGVATPAALEVQRQINAGTGSVNPLLEMGFVPLDAEALATGITANSITPERLSEGSIVPEVATLIAKAVNAPFNTAIPTITGTAQVGQVLTSTNGTWKGSGITYSRQWTANGVVIAGATGTTYTPVVGQIGQVIRVIVTAINSSGSATATSNPTAAVIAA
jgi:hypothetical protein